MNINMICKKTYYPFGNLFSKQLSLLDFGLEKPVLKIIKEFNKDIKLNKLLKFIKSTFSCVKMVLSEYSSKFSK